MPHGDPHDEILRGLRVSLGPTPADATTTSPRRERPGTGESIVDFARQLYRGASETFLGTVRLPFDFLKAAAATSPYEDSMASTVLKTTPAKAIERAFKMVAGDIAKEAGPARTESGRVGRVLGYLVPPVASTKLIGVRRAVPLSAADDLLASERRRIFEQSGGLDAALQKLPGEPGFVPNPKSGFEEVPKAIKLMQAEDAELLSRLDMDYAVKKATGVGTAEALYPEEMIQKFGYLGNKLVAEERAANWAGSPFNITKSLATEALEGYMPTASLFSQFEHIGRLKGSSIKLPLKVVERAEDIRMGIQDLYSLSNVYPIPMKKLKRATSLFRLQSKDTRTLPKKGK